MREPESFKFDIRVRDRVLKSGRASLDELTKQVEKLADVEENAVSIELEQPALGRADGGAMNRVSVAPPTLSTADRDPEGSGNLP